MNKILVIKKIENIFIKNFKIKKNQLNSLSLGTFYKWDSIMHIKLIMEIEKKFKIKINQNTNFTLINYKTIRDYLIKVLVK